MTKENKFTGCTIVTTGKLEHFTRDGINDKILELGAKPGSSVNKENRLPNLRGKARQQTGKSPEPWYSNYYQELNFWRCIHAL